MDMFDVFRAKPDGFVLWIGSADSRNAAQGMIEPLSVNRAGTFLIHDFRTNETLTVHLAHRPTEQPSSVRDQSRSATAG